MDNHLLRIIKDTTEYIETYLLDELDLDRISENVNISKFHLLRIWKSATNTGLMEYVRRRRIASSLGDLIRPQVSIEFLSYKYGFGCERTYNRVFKEEFQITPAKWRRNPVPLQILDRFNADFMSCAGEGIVFFRSITVLPTFTLAGHEFYIDKKDNDVNQTANKYAVSFFYENRHRIIHPVNTNIYYGYTTTDTALDSGSLYLPSFEINQDSIIPPDMKTKSVSPHKYGVFTYLGPHRPEEISSKTLREIWNYIYKIWMPTVQFDLKEVFHFEYVDYSKCNKSYCQCDLFFPISYI